MRIAKRLVDLRSDTVSQMSKGMIKALESAKVGDDVYGDDPTLNFLQEKIAKMFGMEKGLYTPSGTMSNLISILVHCSRGNSAIIGEHSHINAYEQGGISLIANVFPVSLKENPDGTLDLSQVKKKILPENPHFPRTKLIAVENTYNFLAGKALPLEYPSVLSKFCKENGLKLHVDGSRIFNAYFYHKEKNPDLSISEMTEGFDSACVCLSKALQCPVGSVLVGSEKFINEAIRWRKVLGGGLRQGGYIAAAALESMKNMHVSIPNDHKNVRIFSKGLQRIGVNCNEPETNMTVFRPNSSKSPHEYTLALQEFGILANPRVDGSFRVVTHPGVSEEDMHYAIEVIEKIN